MFVFKGTKQIQDSETTKIKILKEKGFSVNTGFNFSMRKGNYKSGKEFRGDRNAHRGTRGGNRGK